MYSRGPGLASRRLWHCCGGEWALRYRLIATDIDGTLLDQNGEATPRTRGTLAELQRRGATVVLNTARPLPTVTSLYRDLGLTGPVIACNGALVYDPGRRTAILHHPLPHGLALQVLGAIRAVDPGLNVGVETAEAWHVDRLDDWLAAGLAAGHILEPPGVGQIEQALQAGARGVSRLYFMAPPATRARLDADLAGAGLTRDISMTAWASGFVEVVAAGVDKGAALRALAALLGVPMASTLFLGDGDQDIPALQAAGLGIAMGNAPAAVQRAAAAVTGPNTEDGWAAAVEQYVLSG